jgi:hypothetical protein
VTQIITNESEEEIPIKVRQGTTLIFIATITDEAGNPIDMSTGHAARLAVRRDKQSTTQLLALAIGSGIVVQGTDNNQLKVTITAAQSRALPAEELVYGFEREETGPAIVTPIHGGPFLVLPEIVL